MPKHTTEAAKRGSEDKPMNTPEKGREDDAISLLTADHRNAEQLFQRCLAEGDEKQRRELVRQVCKELIVHTQLEEEIFYPACRARSVGEESLDEAQVEHDSAKVLIAELLSDRQDSFEEAKIKVLSEYVKHHVNEEEKADSGIFARARQVGIDLVELGQRLQKRKAEITASLEGATLTAPRPRSLSLLRDSPGTPPEGSMNRQSNERERDEHGRFISEDEHRGRGRSMQHEEEYEQRPQRRGSGYEQERMEGGRFASRGEEDDRSSSRRGGQHGGWYGDPEGHARASEKGWEERRDHEGYASSRREPEEDYPRRGGGYSSRQEQEEERGRGYGSRREQGGEREYSSRGGGRGGHGGWYGDPEGHSRASEKGWERGDHGRSGWYGDPEGHSRASEKGWERGDHGRSGWYGDPEGHSRASEKGWERGEHGRSGWYGDPEGHSRASERGWEERGQQSRGRGEEPDGRRERGGGNGDHRGWYGDPQGHSEAARRGWRER